MLPICICDTKLHQHAVPCRACLKVSMAWPCTDVEGSTGPIPWVWFPPKKKNQTSRIPARCQLTPPPHAPIPRGSVDGTRKRPKFLQQPQHTQLAYWNAIPDLSCFSTLSQKLLLCFSLQERARKPHFYFLLLPEFCFLR